HGLYFDVAHASVDVGKWHREGQYLVFEGQLVHASYRIAGKTGETSKGTCRLKGKKKGRIAASIVMPGEKGSADEQFVPLRGLSNLDEAKKEIGNLIEYYWQHPDDGVVISP
ncbi:MAG: hypothetical protein V2A73_13890, partial [Pseudomonadota bacterium]